MIKIIITISLLIGSAMAYGDQKDGQGCIWTDTQGTCGVQLISPRNVPMLCEITAEGTTKSGKKMKSVKTVTLKPWQADHVGVSSTKDDPIVKMESKASCQ